MGDVRRCGPSDPCFHHRGPGSEVTDFHMAVNNLPEILKQALTVAVTIIGYHYPEA
jgi:hypothetical protein